MIKSLLPIAQSSGYGDDCNRLVIDTRRNTNFNFNNNESILINNI